LAIDRVGDALDRQIGDAGLGLRAGFGVGRRGGARLGILGAVLRRSAFEVKRTFEACDP
jgi:hypothetical protein